MKYIKVGTYTFPLNKPFHVVHRNLPSIETSTRIQGFYFLTDRRMVPLWSFVIRYKNMKKEKEIIDQVVQIAHLRINKIIKGFLCNEKSIIDLKGKLLERESIWFNNFIKELSKEELQKFQSIEAQAMRIEIENVKTSKEVNEKLEKTYIGESGEFLEFEYKGEKAEVTQEISEVKNNPLMRLVGNG